MKSNRSPETLIRKIVFYRDFFEEHNLLELMLPIAIGRSEFILLREFLSRLMTFYGNPVGLNPFVYYGVLIFIVEDDIYQKGQQLKEINL